MPRAKPWLLYAEEGLVKRALALNGKQTTLRRCLGCDWWMKSTGPDHRICNRCKNVQTPRTGVGARVRR